jgi:LacI family transcriptional regulator
MTNRKTPPRDKAATIRDVAALAHTSIATVSYVLNDKDRYLRQELKDRVLEAARTLGYVKNAAAGSLKGMRRGILAILVPQFGNNFFTRICVEIEAVARQAGFVVTICNSDEDPEQENSILQRLLSQRIDGCVLCPALSRTESALLLARHQVPCVILERPLGAVTPEQDFVGHDNFQSGYLAARTLLEAGHRRIAFLGWDSPIPNVRDRSAGYEAAMAEFGATVDPSWIRLVDLSQSGGRRGLAALPMQAISALVLGHHHELAKGALLALREQGLSWPADLSIVLVGTPEWSDLIHPSLTCIARPEAEMGRVAARMLLDKVSDPTHRAARMVLPVACQGGASVVPVRSLSQG